MSAEFHFYMGAQFSLFIYFILFACIPLHNVVIFVIHENASENIVCEMAAI